MPTAAITIFAGSVSSWAQKTVELPQVVMEAKHTEYVFTQNTGTPNIINVKSSNPGVATAAAYRVNRVQIVAVAPGKTNVEFFDTAQRVLYKVLVWVTAPNATGGGGTGYNPRLTQLNQIVMLVNRTENAHTPNDKTARISSVTSSNPSVATARTDPPRGIQIFSRALGDTWVNFTNNTTGITYQVHVWVVNKLSDPLGGGGNPSSDAKPKPNPNSKPKPKPNPNPNPKPLPLQGSGLRFFDRCLVGTWRAEAMPTDLYDSSAVMDINPGGLIFKVNPNATATFDYSGLKSVIKSSRYGGDVNSNVITTTFTGKATARISDNRNHVISPEDQDFTSNVTATESYSNGTSPRVVEIDYFVPLGGGAATYTCTADTLILKLRSNIRFKKVQ